MADCSFRGVGLVIERRPLAVTPPSAPPAPEAVAPKGPVDFYDLAKETGMGLKDFKHQIEVQCIRRALIESSGNISEADYASDPPCVLVALRASAVAVGPNGQRQIALTDFFKDFYETALAPDEVLTEVIVPEASARGRQSFRSGYRSLPSVTLNFFSNCRSQTCLREPRLIGCSQRPEGDHRPLTMMSSTNRDSWQRSSPACDCRR